MPTSNRLRQLEQRTAEREEQQRKEAEERRQRRSEGFKKIEETLGGIPQDLSSGTQHYAAKQSIDIGEQYDITPGELAREGYITDDQAVDVGGMEIENPKRQAAQERMEQREKERQQEQTGQTQTGGTQGGETADWRQSSEAYYSQGTQEQAPTQEEGAPDPYSRVNEALQNPDLSGMQKIQQIGELSKQEGLGLDDLTQNTKLTREQVIKNLSNPSVQDLDLGPVQEDVRKAIEVGDTAPSGDTPDDPLSDDPNGGTVVSGSSEEYYSDQEDTGGQGAPEGKK